MIIKATGKVKTIMHVPNIESLKLEDGYSPILEVNSTEDTQTFYGEKYNNLELLYDYLSKYVCRETPKEIVLDITQILESEFLMQNIEQFETTNNE